MNVFLIWVGTALLFFVVYTLALWFRKKKRQRFRARLTIIFLLLVLVPSIPLTFLLANLFTRSADMLLVPGVTEALNTSLDTIRKQTEQPGKLFFDGMGEPLSWTGTGLEDNHIAWLGTARLQDDTLYSTFNVRCNQCPLPAGWNPPWSDVLSLNKNSERSRLISVADSAYYLMIQPLDGSRIALIIYPVDRGIVKARREILSAIRIYDTLSFLKERILEKNIIWALAALLIVILAIIAVIISRRLSESINKPVMHLVQGMTQVANDDLDTRISLNARDEFKFLVTSFNKMTSDLQASRDRLVKAERLAAWQDVARKISHEIRNSLTPISLSLRRLRTAGESIEMPEKMQSGLTAIEAEMKIMERMAAEFSAFARMPEPAMQKIDLNELIRISVLLLRPRFPENPIETDFTDGELLIEADPEQIKQVINNLVKNAAEASSAKKPVCITTRRSETKGYRVEFSVKDMGKGLLPEEMERIFQPYYTTKRGGTGLGMTIVQKIIESHGGSIMISSELKKGSVVRVLL